MKQWDIYLFPFTQERPHPTVVVSHDDRCERCEQINVLICSFAQLNRAPADHEIVLDEADGLDWKTACRCDVIYLLPKAELREMRGHASRERQRQIARKLNECLRFKPW
ncbi:MAG: type II toxin-antitoxin system PemK/MazF family toxin [Verrucomicrobiota bacterium]